MGRITSGLMSSNSDEWATPKAFFEKLDAEFHFDLDVCATHENAKCKHYYTKADDGLSKDCKGVCWMNPPYGRKIGPWVKKARESAEEGATVVCLLPARTDTRWFQDNCFKSSDIRFIRGRLKFNDSKEGAPFPSVVVVFSQKTLEEGKEYTLARTIRL